MTATAAAAASSSDLLQERKRAIESCIKWVDEFGRRRSQEDGLEGDYPHVLRLDKIEFRTMEASPTAGTSDKDSTSHRPPMVGVFAKQKIPKGDVLLTVPEACVVSERHPLLKDVATVCIDPAMKVYRTNVTTQWTQQQQQKKTNPWNDFYKSQGRVLADDELRLALHLTILLFVHRLKTQQGIKLGGMLGDAGAHFGVYFDTLPHSYDSLIFHWKQEELDLMKGTSCYALAMRLRQEVHENWDDSFSSVLLEYLQQQVTESVDMSEQGAFLKECYMDAICTVYSRMHALDVVANTTVTAQNNTRCTCPLADLINGDREDSPRCNVHLLHYPGVYLVLQAIRDIAPGEEILFSYSEVASHVFVTKFGFLPLRPKTGYPIMDGLVVHVVPPPSLVWEEDDPRWQSLTSERHGKALQRRHLLDASPEDGTPFALMGDATSMAKVRGSESWKPPYLNNIHLYAMLSLSDMEQHEEVIVEPCEPGAIMLDMIDYRLDGFPTKSMKEEEELLLSPTLTGNGRTAILYRMLEREILTMWRHAIAKQYDCYGEPSSATKGKKFGPLLTEKAGCAVCQTALSGPVKSCTRCKLVFYCGRNCQKEDWKAGHKEACRPVTVD